MKHHPVYLAEVFELVPWVDVHVAPSIAVALRVSKLHTFLREEYVPQVLESSFNGACTHMYVRTSAGFRCEPSAAGDTELVPPPFDSSAPRLAICASLFRKTAPDKHNRRRWEHAAVGLEPARSGHHRSSRYRQQRAAPRLASLSTCEILEHSNTCSYFMEPEDSSERTPLGQKRHTTLFRQEPEKREHCEQGTL